MVLVLLDLTDRNQQVSSTSEQFDPDVICLSGGGAANKHSLLDNFSSIVIHKRSGYTRLKEPDIASPELVRPNTAARYKEI